MSMDVESRRAIVEYRIERAYKTLEEAEEVAKQDGTTYTGIFYNAYSETSTTRGMMRSSNMEEYQTKLAKCLE